MALLVASVAPDAWLRITSAYALHEPRDREHRRNDDHEPCHRGDERGQCEWDRRLRASPRLLGIGGFVNHEQ